jgi:hypothetical protein
MCVLPLPVLYVQETERAGGCERKKQKKKQRQKQTEKREREK